MKKVIAVVSVLCLTPLLSGCLANGGSGADPTLSTEKYGSYADRQKCQDTSIAGEGKRVCY